MERLKDVIGSDWVPFGRALLKTDSQEVRNIVSKYATEQLSDSKKAYHVLEYWKNKDTSGATLGKVLEACDKINKLAFALSVL
jgi:hypothetical protein